MSLQPDNALVEFYILDATPQGGGIHRFHPGVADGGRSVVWQALTYDPWPVQASGFEVDGTGRMPRPKLRVANVTGTLGALLKKTDITGAKVTRKRTLACYLDAVNFDGGNPGADPNEAFPDDLFFIEQKTEENRQFIEFELASALDIEGVRIPGRQFIRNCCLWEYRGPDCGYTGTAMFDEADQPVTDSAQDRCGKRLSSCKCRNGEGPLNYGGFPACGRMT